MEIVWLIEAPHNSFYTKYWGGVEWTTDPYLAKCWDTEEEATSYMSRILKVTPNIGCRVADHMFG